MKTFEIRNINGTTKSDHIEIDDNDRHSENFVKQAFQKGFVTFEYDSPYWEDPVKAELQVYQIYENKLWVTFIMDGVVHCIYPVMDVPVSVMKIAKKYEI